MGHTHSACHTSRSLLCFSSPSLPPPWASPRSRSILTCGTGRPSAGVRDKYEEALACSMTLMHAKMTADMTGQFVKKAIRESFEMELQLMTEFKFTIHVYPLN